MEVDGGTASHGELKLSMISGVLRWLLRSAHLFSLVACSFLFVFSVAWLFGCLIAGLVCPLVNYGTVTVVASGLGLIWSHGSWIGQVSQIRPVPTMGRSGGWVYEVGWPCK